MLVMILSELVAALVVTILSTQYHACCLYALKHLYNTVEMTCVISGLTPVQTELEQPNNHCEDSNALAVHDSILFSKPMTIQNITAGN